jgi:hypothetical protein
MNKKICHACRTEIDPRATICPHCRTKQPRAKSGAGLVVLIGGGFLVAMCSMNMPPEDPTTKWKAEVAADVGDSVAVQYPATTIMCRNADDRVTVYMTGKLAFWENMRLSRDDVWGSVKKEFAAREAAMKGAYSCRFAPDSFAGDQPRFTVVEKKVIGTENDMFHAVIYLLQSERTFERWWITEDYGSRSPFEKVVSKPKTVIASQSDAKCLKIDGTEEPCSNRTR